MSRYTELVALCRCYGVCFAKTLAPGIYHIHRGKPGGYIIRLDGDWSDIEKKVIAVSMEVFE